MSVQAGQKIAERLAQVVGADNVITDDDRLEYFSRDLSFERYERAEVVVAPGSTEELAEVVRAAGEAGCPIVPRGGGMSYTEGYTPGAENSVLIDMRRMNRIREINRQDGYVEVECGATWEEVYDALRAEGLRTPYYGPLSGRYATVGGALAQQSAFWGAGQHGMVSDSVLTLEVVTGKGEVVRTGSGAHPGSIPFSRANGPDLTGVFVGDTGSYGVKAAATLRTIPFPEQTRHYSISVTDFAQAIRAMEELGREQIAAEIYNLDPFYGDVMAKAGIELMRDHPWSVHFTVEGATDAIVDAGLAHLKGIADGFGTAIEPIIPQVFRDDPFGSVPSIILGPEGQIWLPIHAMFPFSRAVESAAAVTEFAEANKETIERHGVKMSFLTVCVRNEFLFEPSFYWFDEVGEFRLERIRPETVDEYAAIGADEEARRAVLEMRAGLAKVMDDLGGVHFQIGKYYDFEGRTSPEAYGLLRSIKQVVDPDARMNPGSLGL